MFDSELICKYIVKKINDLFKSYAFTLKFFHLVIELMEKY
jgi:hypothetical protein